MYEVGQILYTVIEKHQKVFPLKVVEQVVKKTLSGETIEYTVKFPSNKSEDKLYNLKKFSSVFSSLEDVNKYLTNNANIAINNMIESAKIIQENIFNEKKDIPEDFVNEVDYPTKVDESCNNDNNNVIIDLGNGQKGKLNLENFSESIGQKKT